LSVDNITLDHVISRSRDSTKRFDLSNLRPACFYCNDKKGSKTLEQVREEARLSK
jgi:5-methylcytosine-specific restriction endonuclease McrA